MVREMPHLDVLKALERRRRKRVEIHKSQQDNIQYHAAIRRQVERENIRAERTSPGTALEGRACDAAADPRQVR